MERVGLRGLECGRLGGLFFVFVWRLTPIFQGLRIGVSATIAVDLCRIPRVGSFKFVMITVSFCCCVPIEQMLPMPWDEEEIKASLVATMTLSPKTHKEEDLKRQQKQEF